MNQDHTPDPEFVNHLEWELKSTLRRQGTLNGTSSGARPTRLRLGATVALAAVSMMIGGAGTHAVARSIDSRSASLLIARGEAIVEIAQMRLEPVVREYAKMQTLMEQRTVTEREFKQVEMQYVQAKSEVEVGELELAETRLSGKSPNGNLSAPLVGGRDFVSERMNARRLPIQLRLQLAIDQTDRYCELMEAGVASAREFKVAQAEVVGPEEKLSKLEKHLELRAFFLAGKLSAAEVELRGMRLAAVSARTMAALQLEVLGDRHKRLAILSGQGVVSASELQAVEAELRAIEAQVELVDLELHILDQKLKDTAAE